MAMAVASTNEDPKHSNPVPNKKLTGIGRLLRSERYPRFTYNVPPCSPCFQYQNRPLSPQPTPIFRNALPPEQRRGQGHSHDDKTQKILIYSIVFFLILAIISIPVMIFYVFGPESPTLSIEKVTLYNFPLRFSPLFNITMKVKNPARHIGIFYENDNSIVATYSGIRLCNGGFPPFFQPPKGELLVQSLLIGRGVELPNYIKQKLEDNIRNQRIPLSLNIMSMVRFKMGSVTSRALLKVSCDIILNNLEIPRVINSSCDSSAGFWFNIIRS